MLIRCRDGDESRRLHDFIRFYRCEFFLSPSPVSKISDHTSALSFVKGALHIWQLNAVRILLDSFAFTIFNDWKLFTEREREN